MMKVADRTSFFPPTKGRWAEYWHLTLCLNCSHHIGLTHDDSVHASLKRLSIPVLSCSHVSNMDVLIPKQQNFEQYAVFLWNVRVFLIYLPINTDVYDWQLLRVCGVTKLEYICGVGHANKKHFCYACSLDMRLQQILICFTELVFIGGLRVGMLKVFKIFCPKPYLQRDRTKLLRRNPFFTPP